MIPQTGLGGSPAASMSKKCVQSGMRSILRVKRLCTEMDVFNAEWHKSQGSLRDRGALGLCSTPNGIRVRFRFAP